MSHAGRAFAIGLSLAALLAAGAQAATENDGTRVGVAGAVNPATTGTPPNTNSRLLTVGSDVVFRERITTTAAGQAQILFLDQSALMIGPNSEVTLDEFVYDPNTGKGNLVASLSQGAFRFIGGKLSKQGNATLRTPVATIGIRGSDVTVLFDAAKQVANVIATHGFASIETEAGKINVVTGFMSTVTGTGVGSPTRMTTETVTETNAAFEGQAGLSGGSSQPPTDQEVADSDLSGTVQGAELAAVEPAAGGDGNQSGGSGDGPGSVSDAANDAATTGSQATPPPPPRTIVKTVTGITGAYKLTTGDGTGNFGTRRDGGAPPTFNQPNFNPNNTGTVSGGTLDRFSDGSILASVTDDQDGSNALLVAVPSGAGRAAVLVAEDSAYASNGGALLGQSTDRLYLAPDSRFLAASLSTLNDARNGFTGDRLFVFGGTTVGAAELLAPTTTLRTFRIMPDFLLDSNIPFLRREAGGALANPVVSPLYMISPAGGAATAGRMLQGSIVFQGSGAEQSSAVMLAVGSVFREPTLDNNVTIGAQLRGTTRLSAVPGTGAPAGAGPDIIRMNGATWSVPDGAGRSFYGETTADYVVLDENNQPSAFSGGGGLVNNSAFEGSFHSPNTDTRYGFNHVAVRDPGTGTLGTRTDRVLTGYVGGFGETRTASEGVHFSGPYVITNSDPNGATIETMPTVNNNRVQADLSFQGGGSDFVLMLGHTAGTTTGQRSAFIDDDRFGATQRAATEGVLVRDAPPEEINAKVNGVDAASITYLMSSGVVDGYQASFPGTAFCTCEYTKWGFWGGEIRVPGAENRRDRVHLANWVAGVLPDIGAVEPVGTATFGGHVIGTARNGGAMYVAAGSFTNAYDFAKRSGTFDMTFDSKRVIGTVNAVNGGTDWRHYTSGPGGVSGSGVTGTVNGSFYGQPPGAVPNTPGAVPSMVGAIPKETGGNFTLTNGTNYDASGIFAGKRP